jgi:hypothetical protein
MALLAVGVLATPSSASAVTASITGAYAFDWDYGRRVDACDNASDNKQVRAEWTQNGGFYGNVNNANGPGTCRTGDYLPNRAYRIAACRAVFGTVFSCGSWHSTGY